MKFQPELPGVNPDRTIFQRTIVGRLVEKSVTDMLLGKIVRMPADGLLGDVLQQIPKAGAFLKRGAGNDPLYQLPTLVGKKIVVIYGLRNRSLSGGHAVSMHSIKELNACIVTQVRIKSST